MQLDGQVLVVVEELGCRVPDLVLIVLHMIKDGLNFVSLLFESVQLALFEQGAPRSLVLGHKLVRQYLNWFIVLFSKVF